MNPKPIGKIKPSLRWTDEVLDWFQKKDLKRPRKMKKNKGWQWLKKGKAEGVILGGCITSMMHLRGTKYWPNFFGSVFFWEIPESEENFGKGISPESIDAHLTDLELSGVFNKIKGMIIGRPFNYTREQTNQLVQIVQERTKDYDFPILFNVDIGHSDPMIAAPLGVKIKIDSRKNLFEFTESGTI
jgi:muramoyltetrapeptide carboxypeptidase